jgi:site-specific recombinase XerD
MADSISDDKALSADGPLATYIDPFLQWAREQGYAEDALRQRLRIAAGFSRWLRKLKLRAPDVNSRRLAQYLRFHGRHNKPYTGDARALSQFREFLLARRIITADKRTAGQIRPVEQCTQEFTSYLREERLLAPATILIYVACIDRFLKDRFGASSVDLGKLGAQDVIRFVRNEASRLNPKRAKLLTTALRSFFRYGCFRGELSPDLATAVPVVANWSRPLIPRAIGPDQVRRVLAHIDRNTAVGRRDYAILLLLARLGMRASEVVLLELKDIDWEKGRLRVRGKGGSQTQLPLPKEVGDAIVDYLRNGRPRTSIRRVFLCADAPTRGLQHASTLCDIVRRAVQVAGVDAPTLGAHQFRHGLASEMLRRGASLREIGELLGHRSPETTKIYAKVDVEALRTLALPWPRVA